MRSLGLIAAATLFVAPFMAAPASASTCTAGTTSSYEALGSTGCTVGNLTFSNFNFTTSGTATFNSGNNVIPVSGGGEYGFQVDFTSQAPPTSDVSINYTVTGLPGTKITDVAGSVTGGIIGSGGILLSENLQGLNPSGSAYNYSLGCTSLTGGCSFVNNVSPNGGFNVGKDQEDIAIDGIVGTSQVTNEFSYGVSQTPIPAALPLFAGGLGVLGFVASRKRKKSAAATA
jgi:hypothetical protein